MKKSRFLEIITDEVNRELNKISEVDFANKNGESLDFEYDPENGNLKEYASQTRRHFKEGIITERGKTAKQYGLSRDFDLAVADLKDKEFTTKGITALAKKYRHNPKKAIAYVKDAFEWLWKEGYKQIGTIKPAKPHRSAADTEYGVEYLDSKGKPKKKGEPIIKLFKSKSQAVQFAKKGNKIDKVGGTYKVALITPSGYYQVIESKLTEMQMVNKKTGKDITKHIIAYLEKKITKKEFEKLTGLSKEKLKVLEAKLNEASKPKSMTAKDILDFMLANMRNISSSKIPPAYKKEYIKSMTNMARRKPQDFARDYGKFKKSDWIEDITYNLQNEGKLTEAKLRKGDYVSILVIGGNEIGVVNKVKGRVAYIKLKSMPGSFHPIEAARARYKGKFKGKDLYISEGKLNELKRIKPHDLGYRIPNIRRAIGDFKKGENIAASSKSGKGSFKIEDINDFKKYPTNKWEYAYITEGKVNEGSVDKFLDRGDDNNIDFYNAVEKLKAGDLNKKNVLKLAKKYHIDKKEAIKFVKDMWITKLEAIRSNKAKLTEHDAEHGCECDQEHPGIPHNVWEKQQLHENYVDDFLFGTVGGLKGNTSKESHDGNINFYNALEKLPGKKLNKSNVLKLAKKYKVDPKHAIKFTKEMWIVKLK